MGALVESDIAILDSNKFRSITVEHKDAFQMSKAWAESFLQKLMAERREQGCAWDLPAEVVSKKCSIADDDRGEIYDAVRFDAFLQVTSDSEDELVEDELVEYEVIATVD